MRAPRAPAVPNATVLNRPVASRSWVPKILDVALMMRRARPIPPHGPAIRPSSLTIDRAGKRIGRPGNLRPRRRGGGPHPRTRYISALRATRNRGDERRRACAGAICRVGRADPGRSPISLTHHEPALALAAPAPFIMIVAALSLRRSGANIRLDDHRQSDRQLRPALAQRRRPYRRTVLSACARLGRAAVHRRNHQRCASAAGNGKDCNEQSCCRKQAR